MKVRDAIEALREYPGDAEFELGKLLAISPEKPDEAGEEQFEVVLDLPIIGFAHNEVTKHVRLIVEAGPQITAFGKVTRLEDLEGLA